MSQYFFNNASFYNLIDLFFIRYKEGFQYWCWSRGDYNETDLRQQPINLNLRVEKFTSFSTSFFYNPRNRSIKCNSPEEWAENWIHVGDQWNSPKVPCSINAALVATFEWYYWSDTL